MFSRKLKSCVTTYIWSWIYETQLQVAYRFIPFLHVLTISIKNYIQAFAQYDNFF